MLKQIFSNLDIKEAFVSKVKKTETTQSGCYFEIEESKYGCLSTGNVANNIRVNSPVVYVKAQVKNNGKKYQFKFYDLTKYSWITGLADLNKYKVTREFKKIVKDSE